MAKLTKYVSVTFTGGSNDGSTANPYTTIEAARSDIQSNRSGDAGPHYIILSESSAATTIYSASYGMPAWNGSAGTGWPQELWIGSYDAGVILSGAHGQDIIIDPGPNEAFTSGQAGAVGGFSTRTHCQQKSAIELYGSGSGVHNVTLRGCGSNNRVGDGAIKGNKRPYYIRGVNVREAAGGGITGLGDYSSTDSWTIIDSCRIELTGAINGARAISFVDDSRNALINNCLIIFSGTDGAMPSRAIYAAAGGTDRATASFCTFVVRMDDAVHTDGSLGITAPRVENCIVSASLVSDANLNFPFISADVATNNLYAGFGDSLVTNGVRRTFNGTSASFHSTELRYKKNSATLALFNDPDTTINSVYADWTLAAGAPAANAGTALSYLDLTGLDLSGSSRADPPDIGTFELVIAGYANIIIGVAAGNLGKVIGVTKANTSKVIGT